MACASPNTDDLRFADIMDNLEELDHPDHAQREEIMAQQDLLGTLQDRSGTEMEVELLEALYQATNTAFGGTMTEAEATRLVELMTGRSTMPRTIIDPATGLPLRDPDTGLYVVEERTQWEVDHAAWDYMATLNPNSLEYRLLLAENSAIPATWATTRVDPREAEFAEMRGLVPTDAQGPLADYMAEAG